MWLKKEGKTLDKEAADLLATLAEGSFRDSLTLLDQVSSSSEKTINVKDVQRILGLSDNQQILQFFEAIGLGDRNAALEVVDVFLANGGDPSNFISQSIDFIRSKLRENPTPQIVSWLKGMLDALNQLKVSPSPNLPLELFVAENIGIDQLTARLPTRQANRLQTTAKDEQPVQPASIKESRPPAKVEEIATPPALEWG